jgi:hypothetical protein
MRTIKRKSCVRCGKIFQPTGRCAKFCGDICRDVTNAERSLAKRLAFRASPQWVGQGNRTPKGKNHPGYTGINNFPSFKKDKCERCGSKKYLLVHHKDENRRNNKRSNAETLCKRCHQLHHGCINRLVPHKKLTRAQRKHSLQVLEANRKLLHRHRRADGTYAKIKPVKPEETAEQYSARLTKGKLEAYARKGHKPINTDSPRFQSGWRDRLMYPAKYRAIRAELRRQSLAHS